MHKLLVNVGHFHYWIQQRIDIFSLSLLSTLQSTSDWTVNSLHTVYLSENKKRNNIKHTEATTANRSHSAPYKRQENNSTFICSDWSPYICHVKISIYRNLICHSRGHVTFLVVEHLAKVLQIMQIYNIEYSMCKFLLVFHGNYVSILYRFWDIQRWTMPCPWNFDKGSFKVTENGTIW